MVPHTFHWPQTPFDSTWKLLKRINMLDLNPRETKPCFWLRAVTYDVSDWIAAVRSPRVISVSLNSVTLGQCLVINWTVCQLELKRKQKWANVFEFFLPLLRWLQWKIHLPPDHIIIITIGIYDVFASPWDFSFIWRHWNAYESTDYQLEQWLYSLAMPTRVIVVLWPLGRPAVYQRLYLLRHTQYSSVMIIIVYFLYISLLAPKVLLEDLSYLPTVWSD